MSGDVGDCAGDRNPVDGGRNTHCTRRDAVDQVHGSVDRVHDPGDATFENLATFFFPENDVRGSGGTHMGTDTFPDQRLAGTVDLGDRVHRGGLRFCHPHPGSGT